MKRGLNTMTLAQAKVRVIESQTAGRAVQQEAKPAGRRRLDPAVAVSLIAVLVFALGMGYVAQRARLAALAYQLHAAERRLAEVERIDTYLSVEIERARSLERIEQEARYRLGMVAPATTAWVVLRPAAEARAAEANTDARRNSGLVAALSDWFNRVRSEIRAALPRPPAR